MAHISNTTEPDVFDLVGIGFGPSNLAIAALAASLPGKRWDNKRLLFLEKKKQFGWHTNMLLPDARMQISFLKDLITLKVPTSPYTFINYLKEHRRLDDFINLQTFHPTRDDFHRYLSWAAEKLACFVRYESNVEHIKPVFEQDGSVSILTVHYKDQVSKQEHQIKARNVVVAPGGAAYVPAEVTLNNQIFHSSSFLEHIARFEERKDYPYRFLIVGAGQSAAEIFRYLIDTFPNADVTQVIRRFAFAQADSSPFTNEIFNFDNVELFFRLPKNLRNDCLEELTYTNYSAVDDHLIKDIFQRIYDQKVRNQNRFRIRRFMNLERCYQDGEEVVAQLHNLAKKCTIHERFDGIILATGYSSMAERFLSELRDQLVQSENQDFVIRRDYSLESLDPARFRPKIYIQGLTTESTHGLTSSLISVLPLRAEDILTSAFGALS